MNPEGKPSRFHRFYTRAGATLGLVAAVACILIVAIGGAFPAYKHGTSIVAPRTGDVWQVGELHTVQWTVNGVRTTNKSGDPIQAIFMLSYEGGAPNSHILLGHLTDWFPVTDRLANVLVPSVPTRTDYSIYMLSEDNREINGWSGLITIFNPEDVEGTEDPPNTLVVTTAPPISVTISLTSTFSDSELPTADLPSATTNATASSTTLSASESLSNATVSVDATGSMSTSADLEQTPQTDVEVISKPTHSHRGSSASTADSTPTPPPTNRMKRMRTCQAHDKELCHPRRIHLQDSR